LVVTFISLNSILPNCFPRTLETGPDLQHHRVAA
jgi:hypothetical protein